MKKWIAIALALVMVLSLAGCSSEEEKLYERYADVIGMLENEDYTGVINYAANLEIQKQVESGEQTPASEALAGNWFTYYTDNITAPESVTMNADGSCVVDGKTMAWMKQGEGDMEYMSGIIMSEGQNQYYFVLENYDSNAVPQLSLYTCEVFEWGIGSGDRLAVYVPNADIAVLTNGYWYCFASDDDFTRSSFWMNLSYASGFDMEFDWSILSDEDGLTVHLDARNGYTDKYTLVLSERDGYPVITVTNDDTGAQGLYYDNNSGYDSSWPEVRYPEAMEYLEDILYDVENGYSVGIWVYDENGEGHEYSGSEAWAYVQQLFIDLGDYKDSAEIAGNFVVLENMLTNVHWEYTDNLGNTSSSREAWYSYDSQGRLTAGYAKELRELYGVYDTWDNLYFTYGEDDRPESIQYGNVTAILTPEYDDDGNLVKVAIQYNSRTDVVNHTYDDNGNRIYTEIVSDDSYTAKNWSYTYDSNGRLIQKVYRFCSGRNYTYTYDYTYDGNGYLINEDVTLVTHDYYHEWDETDREYKYRDKVINEHFSYTNDDLGRPLTAEYTTDDPDYSYATTQRVYTYTDLYFYNGEIAGE